MIGKIIHFNFFLGSIHTSSKSPGGGGKIEKRKIQPFRQQNLPTIWRGKSVNFRRQCRLKRQTFGSRQIVLFSRLTGGGKKIGSRGSTFSLPRARVWANKQHLHELISPIYSNLFPCLVYKFGTQVSVHCCTQYCLLNNACMQNYKCSSHSFSKCYF